MVVMWLGDIEMLN